MEYRIKKIRESIGMSQSELSRRAGVSRGIICSLEANPKTVTTTKTLKKIADALGTKMELLFSAEDVQ
jgi:transcriptional regulator with XRE-family HTH domain